MQNLYYLGFHLPSEGLSPDPKKTEATNTFPSPKTQKNLTRFVGLSSYYKRFVRGFAKIDTALFSLFFKNVPFKWSPACEEPFFALNQALCAAPCLILVEPNDRFIITTNSSDLAIRFDISQERNGIIHPVDFAERTLRDFEKRFPIHVKELLALIKAIKQICRLLQNQECTVYTDSRI